MGGLLQDYETVRRGSPAYYKQPRGLIAVWGKEAVQFLNGLITNDVAKLDDGAQMLAAFPNAQGRLLALVRVVKSGDKFLFETDGVTHEKVFQNLFRFTFAGDFFVEDMSDAYEYFEVFGAPDGLKGIETLEVIEFDQIAGKDYFVPEEHIVEFEQLLSDSGALMLSDELYELLRIENGVPKYGVDMDESTVVLETGLDDAVSFTKGCYIGQEIIARIHFRGHVAKRLTGLILEADSREMVPENYELTSLEGKNAGQVTSFSLSPRIGKIVALAYVRYDYLAEGTKLKMGGILCEVKEPPFFDKLAQVVP
jgi:folate-binding protein YgfZ